MIKRNIAPFLQRLIPQFPAIAITGPRQSGKTTLARMIFNDKPYVSFENPDILEYAENDSRSFLAEYSDGAIFDEVQRCPSLFSYLQQIIDEGPKYCRFILTGSQQFGLRSRITQSLAGRIANCTLLPFSFDEWYRQQHQTDNPRLRNVLFTGLYPPILDRGLDAPLWYENYIQNYIERDVRQILNIQELRTFHLFLKMCAARCGQMLNLSGLAADCGISVNTAKGWISVLEASYIIFLLQPHYKNFGKRLIKTPKLYFFDTGLAAHLLSVRDGETLHTHSMRGPLFETFIISELRKQMYNAGSFDSLYYWRDHSGHEVDVVYERDEVLHTAEIKSGQTIASDAFKGLNYWKALAGNVAGTCHLIYGGDTAFTRNDIRVVPWSSGGEIFGTSEKGTSPNKKGPR